MVASGMSLVDACKKLGVPRTTVQSWCDDPRHDGSARWAMARDQFVDVHVQEMERIVDCVAEDPNAIAKARLQLDARKWVFARIMGKRFGDRVQNEVSGPGGGDVIVRVNTGVRRADD